MIGRLLCLYDLCKHGSDITVHFLLLDALEEDWDNLKVFSLCKSFNGSGSHKRLNSPKHPLIFASGYANTGGHFVFF